MLEAFSSADPSTKQSAELAPSLLLQFALAHWIKVQRHLDALSLQVEQLPSQEHPRRGRRKLSQARTALEKLLYPPLNLRHCLHGGPLTSMWAYTRRLSIAEASDPSSQRLLDVSAKALESAQHALNLLTTSQNLKETNEILKLWRWLDQMQKMLLKFRKISLLCLRKWIQDESILFFSLKHKDVLNQGSESQQVLDMIIKEHGTLTQAHQFMVAAFQKRGFKQMSSQIEELFKQAVESP